MNKLLLIGDSNIYRNVSPERLATKIGCQVTLLQATRATSLEIGLREISKTTYDVVVVSALANILSDAGLGTTPDRLESILEETTVAYVRSIYEKAGTVKDLLLLSPLPRNNPLWFNNHLAGIRSVLLRETNSLANVTVLPEFPLSEVSLLPDDVHLTNDSGSRYYEYLSSCLLDIQVKPTTSQPVVIGQLESMLHSSTQPTNSDILDVLTRTVVPQLQEISGVREKVNILLLITQTQPATILP